MSDTLERLREYLAEKDRLQEDVAVLDVEELRALLDIAEAAQPIAEHSESPDDYRRLRNALASLDSKEQA